MVPVGWHRRQSKAWFGPSYCQLTYLCLILSLMFILLNIHNKLEKPNPVMIFLPLIENPKNL